MRDEFLKTFKTVITLIFKTPQTIRFDTRQGWDFLRGRLRSWTGETRSMFGLVPVWGNSGARCESYRKKPETARGVPGNEPGRYEHGPKPGYTGLNKPGP
jgi:hypothetical protein